MIPPITINGIEVRPEDIRYDNKDVWVGSIRSMCDNPRLEFAKLLGMFTDEGRLYQRNGSAIHERVQYDIRKVQIGIGCVIGGVGFGMEYDEHGNIIQIPHLGGVEIGDGVCIHNNVCIDRGVTSNTIIGGGTCIDNLVHVAHGCKIGRNSLIVAGTVLGGSCTIGDYVFIGMNVCIKQHVRIGNNCVIGMGAVVTKDIPDNQVWIGSPAKYFKDTQPRNYKIT